MPRHCPPRHRFVWVAFAARTRCVPEDFTVADLVEALRRAAVTRLSPAMVHESLPAVDGRIAAEEWMYQ